MLCCSTGWCWQTIPSYQVETSSPRRFLLVYHLPQMLTPTCTIGCRWSCCISSGWGSCWHSSSWERVGGPPDASARGGWHAACPVPFLRDRLRVRRLIVVALTHSRGREGGGVTVQCEDKVPTCHSHYRQDNFTKHVCCDSQPPPFSHTSNTILPSPPTTTFKKIDLFLSGD